MYIDEAKIRDILIYIEALLTDSSNKDNYVIKAIQNKINNLYQESQKILLCTDCGCYINTTYMHQCFNKHTSYRIKIE